MNKDTWNKLPKDLQKVFTDNSGEDWVREVGQVWEAADEGGIAVAKKAGNTHIQLSAAETEAFRKAMEPVISRWIRDVESKGINGNQLVKVARETIAKHAK